MTDLYRPYKDPTPPPPSQMEKCGELYRDAFYIIRDPQYSQYTIKTIDYLDAPLGLDGKFTLVKIAKNQIDNWLENMEKKKNA